MIKYYRILSIFVLAWLYSSGVGYAQGDDCASAVTVTCGANISGTTVGLNPETQPFCGTSDGTGGAGWFRFVGTGDDITASLCGSAYDTKIRVFEGTCAALVCVTGNDDNFTACGNNNSEVEFSSVVGTEYFILVHGFGTNEGAFTFNLTCTPPPPPAIELSESGANILNGGTLDVGSIVVPGSDTKTVTITNNGGLPLTIPASGITLTSGGPEFSIGALPTLPLTLNVGGTATFDVTLNVTTGGLYFGAVQIDSDDPDDNPFILNLSGSGADVLYSEDFDGLTGPGLPTDWTVIDEQGTTNTWALGAGVTALDNESIYVSNDAGVTNTYDNSITTATTAVSESFDATGYKDLVANFDFIANGEVGWDYGSFYVSTDGTTFTEISPYSDPYTVGAYNGNTTSFFDGITTKTAVSIPLPSSLNNQSVVHIAFRWDNDDLFGSGEAFAVDNIVVTGVVIPPNDVAVTAIIDPANAGLGRENTCTENGSAVNITVEISNLGTVQETSIPVSYSIDGAPAITETWTGTLDPGNTTTYTFTTTEDFSTLKSIEACTALLLDGENSNDCFTDSRGGANLPNAPVTIDPATPYVQDFETIADVTLTGTSTTTTLAVGGINELDYDATEDSGRLRTMVTAGGGGPTANSGTKAIVLDKDGFGTDPSNFFYLTLNMSNYDVATDVFYLDFWINDANDETDTDDLVWVRGSCNDPWVQIYDWNTGGEGDITNLDITATLNGAGQNYSSSFGIRFGQNDNAAYEGGDGLIIDDIQIRNIPADDVAITAVSIPGNGREATCDVAGMESITVEITNNGSAQQTSIPVKYSIDGGVTFVTETWTGTLDPATSTTYTFTTTEDFSGLGINVEACTELVGDANTTNDCMTQLLGNLPNPVLAYADFPYDQDFETANTIEITGTTDKQFGIAGITEMDFETSTTDGRVRTNIGGNSFNSGTNSLVLEASSDAVSPDPENNLTFTLNMSAFDAANDNFELGFWYRDSGDETDANDLVWIRGSCNDPWIQVYNWNTGPTVETVSGIDISGTLIGAGQNYSSSFGVRFGQADNFTYGLDGLAIDDILITYIPPEPDIEVSGNGVIIVDGDITPDLADDTDYGDVPVTNTEIRTFTIANTGSLPLGLSLPITSSNSNFIPVYTGASVIPAGGTETFDVIFTAPATASLEVSTITINSNDPDAEAVYTFDVQANAIVPLPTLELQGNAQVINCGDTTPSTMDGTDFGDVGVSGDNSSNSFDVISLTTNDIIITDIQITGAHPGDFTITPVPTYPLTVSPIASFTIVFDPTAIGLRTATVEITSNDGGTPGTICTFDIQGNGIDTEIDVLGNGVSIANNDLTPDMADHTDFGGISATALAPNDFISRTFTIDNPGDADLILTGVPFVTIADVTVPGGSAGNVFTVNTQPTSPIASGASSDFIIDFNPDVVGIFDADVTILNNDADEGTYVFRIQGEGLPASPEISVTGLGIEIASGDVTPDVTDDTDFGDVTIFSGTDTHTFTIHNTGDADLNLTGTPIVTLTGSFDFTVSAQPASALVVANTGTETFDITVVPTVGGIQTATVSIANDDNDENPYTFDVQVNGVTPDIDVFGNGFLIVDGDATCSPADGTDFGIVPVGTTETRSFVIFNSGGADLEITGISVVPIVGGDFTINSPTTFPITIPPSGFENLTIDGIPATLGLSEADINILSNDPDAEMTYTFRVCITGVAAEILVSGGDPTALEEIVSGDTSPTTTDGTDFGDVAVGSAGDISTFYIKNDDPNTPLSITDITLSGANASEFAIVNAAASIVAPLDSTSFTLRFIPGATGVRTATVEITNTDLDENPYTFAIQGNGVDPATTTALPRNLADANLVIYPNPSRDIFRISVEGNVSSTEGSIQVFDTRGSKIHSQRIMLSNGNTEFNLSEVASGKYIVIIQLGKENIARTIVKE